MRNKLALNTITSLVYQVIVLICGLILPRYILTEYGSNVNGLLTSITQFIAIITLMDLGVGAVVQSNFYKPVANKDNKLLSQIFVSSNNYFRKIGLILVGYIVVLSLLYPMINAELFGYQYIFTLILILSIDKFAQYFFGITNQLLAIASQRGYVVYTMQGITLIINTLAAVILITMGASIHAVKLSTALIYLARPIVLYYYVRKNYNIDRKIKYTEEPIKQKWNGLAQHIAAYILDGTDVIVLTLFSTLSNVSIYSVYLLVIAGIKQLMLSLSNGFSPMFGALWAKNDLPKMKKAFQNFEYTMNTLSLIVCSCTLVLIVPFVRIYTAGITDVDYTVPLFATIIVIAYSFHTIRLPYNMMILASGRFKQTQKSYVVAAVLNITISVIAVNLYGLVGVAIGTFIALSYQVIWQANYVYKNLLNIKRKFIVKRFSVNGISLLCSYLLTQSFELQETTYLSWVMMAISIFLIVVVVNIVISLIFYKKETLGILNMVKKITNRKAT